VDYLCYCPNQDSIHPWLSIDKPKAISQKTTLDSFIVIDMTKRRIQEISHQLQATSHELPANSYIPCPRSPVTLTRSSRTIRDFTMKNADMNVYLRFPILYGSSENSWKNSHINAVASISWVVFPVILSGNGDPPGQVCPPSAMV